MKAHLLYRDRDLDPPGTLPAQAADLVQDLELTILLQTMAAGDKFLFDVAVQVLLSSLVDPEDIRYRQDMLADALRNPELIRRMYDLAVQALETRRSLWGYASMFPASVLSGAVGQLEAYLSFLRQLRALADDQAQVVQSAALRRLFVSLQEDLDDEYFTAVETQLKRLHFRHGLLVSARLDRDNTGTDYLLRAPEWERPGWKERIGLAPRSTYSFSLPPRDEAGGQALEDLRNRGMNQVANAVAQSADHVGSYFTMLRRELGFYVGCLNLHEKLTDLHQPTCLPVPEPLASAALQASELRDPCLALQGGCTVVGNTVDASSKSLIIVTGANSGGKSTFLRSVGVAQLMMQAGMYVTAVGYRASVRSGTFTHFLRQEDETLRAGRLEEELARMSTLADRVRTNALVLFNESFSSTNEREGSEIARQVVGALRQAGCRVVYVTHQFDFADGYRADEATTFLRAVRRDDATRDYRLITGPPEATAYGRDLYAQIFGPGVSERASAATPRHR